MEHLGLRLRIFLFFAALGIGAVAVTGVGLWLGYRQAGAAAGSPFLAAGIVAGFGILGVTAAIWLLFDENVAKPVERLAADLRARAHGGVTRDLDQTLARYLGDLAPAAAAVSKRLSSATIDAAETVAQRTADLAFETRQLTSILTDIPLAVMMVSPAHQIVLYDGQSAELLEAEAPARLNASVFDYLKEAPIKAALAELDRSGERRRPIVAETVSGRFYSGHIRALGEGAGYMLLLEPLTPDAERPLTYDFALIHSDASTDQRSSSLRGLTYVIFDTETTGLDTTRDEIVQIGAVRVVNGRIVEGERFDTLVNPGRPIPPGSTRVHGISDDMVAAAPTVTQAVASFHAFARGAVLVAHNAPFDLAFLRRAAGQTELSFDHPVLDTVLLSAVLFGGSATHTLDALAERLDVDIAGNLRHTAIGDAVATAQVFAACLAMLEGRGFGTFGSVLSEVRKHERIVKDVNRDA
jgi:DNA polymerase III subunit epsilon